jgi:broad specificity phosphatase PhoE
MRKWVSMEKRGELWLVRHGETEWSLSGAHTGRTDIPLTDRGRKRAEDIGRYLARRPFSLVLTSPLSRALETCRIAGYGEVAQIDPDLREWDYGVYEGKTTASIRQTIPDWSVWGSEIPDGESVNEVGERARNVIERAVEADGDVLLFAHGHILRILAACWAGLPDDSGRILALDTAALSILGYERETRVIRLWNENVCRPQ